MISFRRYTQLSLTDIFVIGFLVLIAVLILAGAAAGDVDVNFGPGKAAELDTPIVYSGSHACARWNWGPWCTDGTTFQIKATEAYGGVRGLILPTQPFFEIRDGDCVASSHSIAISPRWVAHTDANQCISLGQGTVGKEVHVYGFTSAGQLYWAGQGQVNDGVPFGGLDTLGREPLFFSNQELYVRDGNARINHVDLPTGDLSHDLDLPVIRVADSNFMPDPPQLSLSGGATVRVQRIFGQQVYRLIVSGSVNTPNPANTKTPVATVTQGPPPTAGPCIPGPIRRVGFQCTNGCEEVPCPGTSPTPAPTLIPPTQGPAIPPTPCITRYVIFRGACREVCTGEFVDPSFCSGIGPTPTATVQPTDVPTEVPTEAPTEIPSPGPTPDGGGGGSGKTALWIVLGIVVVGILVAVLGRKR